MKVFSTLGIFLFLRAAALAQTPPTSYTIVQDLPNNSGTMTVYRNGSKAAIETATPANGSTPAGDSVTLYDLSAGATISWLVNSDQPSCGSGRFSGDWGDPFAQTDLKDAIAKGQLKPAGTETLIGIPTKIYAGTVEQMNVREWLDEKDGLVLKATMAMPGAQPQAIANITKVTFGPPPAAKFTPPAACAGLKPPPTPEELIAAETNDSAANYANAYMGPGSKNSCSIVVRAVEAKTMTPLTHLQVAIDTAYKIESPPHYDFGVGDDGMETFSGGSLRDLSAQVHNGAVRVDNVPPYFILIVNPIHKGHSGGPGLIYRQCLSPTTVLLFVFKDYGQSDESIDALWVKSGKFAAPPAN